MFLEAANSAHNFAKFVVNLLIPMFALNVLLNKDI